MNYPDGSVDLVGDSGMGQPDGEGGWVSADLLTEALGSTRSERTP